MFIPNKNQIVQIIKNLRLLSLENPPLAAPLLLGLALANHDKGGPPAHILPHVVQDVST
jgi:hypothetical protein